MSRVIVQALAGKPPVAPTRASRRWHPGQTGPRTARLTRTLESTMTEL